ncbi:MAG: hypothetical protein KME65_03660 [Candidatus Thiodiazotropha sp. (ex Ctena orbiculata)]|uniref:Uncharacterized protein n=1 Tax=Candidatus Thiodiazotropha taylori TaxID=2792791 RepID=A0A944QTK8_9GAMM|nr:hypothetical protein [Candidatus Thiodiazotropha taylori]MBV2138813.1 hypothetical protein [Candidatus Thiodiazotropha taylori]
MRRPTSRQRRLVILFLVLITFSLAYYAGHLQKQRNRMMPEISGILISPPLPAPSMELYNQAGEPFSNTDLQGHWSLLMIDPTPETASPAALTRLIRVHNRLGTDPGLQRQMAFYYLPLNKRRATPLSFSRMSDNIHALQGEAERVDDLLDTLFDTASEAQQTLYLIGPKTRIHALFTPDLDAATIAVDLNTLIDPVQ